MQFTRALTIVPGVYTMTGRRYSLRPGGDASLEELREWARQEAGKARRAGSDAEIRIIAHTMPRSARVLIVESYDLATGETAAFRQHYRPRLFSGKVRADGPLEPLDQPSPLVGS